MKIRKNISFSKELDFVDYVVSKTFPANDKGVFYVSGAKDFWFKVGIVTFFTDKDIIGEAGANIDKLAEKIYEPNFLENITKNIDKAQLKRISANVNEMVQFKKDKLIHDTGIKEFLKVLTTTLNDTTKDMETALSEIIPTPVKDSDVVVNPE